MIVKWKQDAALIAGSELQLLLHRLCLPIEAIVRGVVVIHLCMMLLHCDVEEPLGQLHDAHSSKLVVLDHGTT